MTELAAAQIFATLVGLICNWRQERATVTTEKFQDFITWLTEHNFAELKSLILQSVDVQHELKDLLERDAATLSAKLDFVCTSVSSVSDRIGEIAPLVRALNAPTDRLSDQAVEILKQFEESGADRMIVFGRHQQLGFLVDRGNRRGGRSLVPREPRFLQDDIAALDSLGFIRLVDRNNDGDPICAFTRQGSAFVKQMAGAGQNQP